MVNFTVKLITPRQKIYDNIISSLYGDVVKRYASNLFRARIMMGIEEILGNSFRSQKEYVEMIDRDGILRGELGVVNSAFAMDSLVKDWVKSTHVRVRKPIVVGNKIRGKIISVTAIDASYEDVLNKAYASYTTEKGDEINWLDWLLTKGNRIMVLDHMSVYSKMGIKGSRTGNTVMRKTKGRGWAVPFYFSGTPRNNFCTRAIEDAIPKIQELFITELNRN